MSDGSSRSRSRVAPSELREFVEAVLRDAGVVAEHAGTISEALVRADLRGVDSHGVARLRTYVEKFEAGGFNPDPDIAVEQVADSTVLVDADDGPGQSAGVRAMDEAMERANDHGVGVAGVTNSNHFGTAAYYTERASMHDYIGVSMTNVGSDVAPFGGVDPFLGTNPLSFSIPTDRDFPITLDMATSVVAMGKIDHATGEGEDIPGDWALDDAGEPTTDPNEVAALRPVGGPKGFGLAMVVDALCGILTGVGTSKTIGALYDDFDEPMRLGHFFAVIDPSAFRPIDDFTANVGAYLDDLKSQATRDDIDEIRVPGELEAMAMERNEQEGVPINEDARKGLTTLSEEYEIPLPPGIE